MSTPTAPPAPREEQGGNILTQRMGPFATWVWLLIGTVLVLGWAYYRNRKAAATTTQATAGQAVPAQQVPDIIIQNQEEPDGGAPSPQPSGAVPPAAPPPAPPPSGGGIVAPGPGLHRPPTGGPGPGTGSAPPPKTGGQGPPQYKIVTVGRWTPENTPWNSTLWGIAGHEGVKGGWQTLARLNGIKNPRLIRPGQKIRVPVS